VADVRLKRAFEDGQEQLARMNYFHEVREKQQQQQQHQQHQQQHQQHQTAPPNGRHAQHSNNHHHHHVPTNGAHNSPSATAATAAAAAAPTAASSSWRLSTFLHTHLPGIEEQDLQRYENELKKEGFDSLGMLKYLEKEDVGSWKKAHRRAMLEAVERLKEK